MTTPSKIPISTASTIPVNVHQEINVLYSIYLVVNVHVNVGYMATVAKLISARQHESQLFCSFTFTGCTS